MYGHHSHTWYSRVILINRVRLPNVLVVSSTRKLSVFAQCRCIRGKYIYMYLQSTVLLFVFVYILGILLFGDIMLRKNAQRVEND